MSDRNRNTADTNMRLNDEETDPGPSSTSDDENQPRDAQRSQSTTDEDEFADRLAQFDKTNNISDDERKSEYASSDHDENNSSTKPTKMKAEHSHAKDKAKNATVDKVKLNKAVIGDSNGKRYSGKFESVALPSRFLGHMVNFALTQPYGEDNTSSMENFSRRCTNCRKVGHDRRNCPQPRKDGNIKPGNNVELNKRSCRNCNSQDHDRRTCPFEKRNQGFSSDEESGGFRTKADSDAECKVGDDTGVTLPKEPEVTTLSRKTARQFRKLAQEKDFSQKLEDNIEKEWDHLRRQFATGKDRLRPSIIYTTFPYDNDALQWNAEHTQNQEGHYCYCGRNKLDEDVAQKPMLSCGNCLQLFHFECVGVISIPLLCGDDAYRFRCSMCSDEEKDESGELYERVAQSWTNILRITLCNLLLRYAERGKRYFNLRKDILRFIQTYWSSLTPERCTTKNLEPLLTAELTQQDDVFIKDSKGDWSLTKKGLPITRCGLPHILEVIVNEESRHEAAETAKTKCIAYRIGDIVLAPRDKYHGLWPAQVTTGSGVRLKIRYLGCDDDDKWIRGNKVETYEERPAPSNPIDPRFEAALDVAETIKNSYSEVKSAPRKRERVEPDYTSDGPPSQKQHRLLDDQRSYSCTVCERLFSSAALLESHCTVVHGEYAASEDMDDVGEAARIVRNLDDTSRKLSANREKSKNSICPICDKSFLYNAGLVLHMKAHSRSPTAERHSEFPCPKCSRTFPRSQELSLHLRMHRNQKEDGRVVPIDEVDGVLAPKGRAYADEVIGHEVFVWRESEKVWKKGIITSLNVEECKHRVDFSEPDASSPDAKWYHLYEELLKWPNGIPKFACDGEVHSLSLFRAKRVLDKRTIGHSIEYLIQMFDEDMEQQKKWVAEDYVFTKRLIAGYEGDIQTRDSHLDSGAKQKRDPLSSEDINEAS